MSEVRNSLKPNAIVHGALFNEQIKIITTISMGDAVKLVGKGLESGQVYEPVLNDEQLSKLEVIPEKEPFDGDAARFRLGIEAMRLKLAYEYDPYFSYL